MTLTTGTSEEAEEDSGEAKTTVTRKKHTILSTEFL